MIQLLEWQSTLVSRRFQCFWHIWIAASKSAFSVTGYTPNTYHHGNLRVPRNPGNRAFNKALLRDILNIMVVKNPLRPYFLFVGTLRFPWYQKGKRRQAFHHFNNIHHFIILRNFKVFFSKLGPTFWVHKNFFRRWWKWRKKAPFTTGFCSSLEGSVIWRAFFHLKAGWRTFFSEQNFAQHIFAPPSMHFQGFLFWMAFFKTTQKTNETKNTGGWLGCPVFFCGWSDCWFDPLGKVKSPQSWCGWLWRAAGLENRKQAPKKSACSPEM